MKTILIATNICTIFALALGQNNKYFITLSTSSSDVSAKFCRSHIYYKKIGGMDPIQEWADGLKVKMCRKIFKSRFFIMNNEYEEYENILKKIKAAAEKHTYSSEGLKKRIIIKHASHCKLMNLVLPVYLCYLDRNIELYISTDYTNTNNFFLYSYIRKSSNMRESSGVTLLAYAELHPRMDSRTNYELDMLYFTQRNVVDENNNLIERKPGLWTPNPLRLCAAGYHHIAENMNLSSLEIYKVTNTDVYTSKIDITAVTPTRHYNAPIMLCQTLKVDTNTHEIYYFTPDLENNSSVFYLTIENNFFNIDRRISSAP